jgi:hypothetical protein
VARLKPSYGCQQWQLVDYPSGFRAPGADKSSQNLLQIESKHICFFQESYSLIGRQSSQTQSKSFRQVPVQWPGQPLELIGITGGVCQLINGHKISAKFDS